MTTIPFIHNEIVAIYNNRLFIKLNNPENAQDTSHVLLRTFPGEDASNLTDFSPVRGTDQREKVVVRSEIDALYKDQMYFRWRGQEFAAYRVTEDVVGGWWLGGDPTRSFQRHLEGNQYDGFTGEFPLTDVDDLYVKRSDYLHGQTERLELDRFRELHAIAQRIKDSRND